MTEEFVYGVVAKCTEDVEKQPTIVVCLDEGSFGKPPALFVEIPPECYPKYYEGEGYFEVSLSKVFDFYLEHFFEETHGERTPEFVAMLREYADKIEKALPIQCAEFLKRFPESEDEFLRRSPDLLKAAKANAS